MKARIRRAIESERARLVYPRFYAMNRWFPWFARWIVDAAAPAYSGQRRPAANQDMASTTSDASKRTMMK